MRKKIEERTSFSWPEKELLLKDTNGLCAHCGVLLDRYTNLTVEHVIPLNKGGTNDSGNLTVLCEDCNKMKSDMIMPISWYPYLRYKKRKSMAEQFNRYMKETDYLSENCLLPMDTFRIEVPVTVTKKTARGMKTLRMPAYIHGTRMERDDAFWWLKSYSRSLQYRDQMGTMQHPSEWDSPCYLLKKGDIEVAMVNPRMIHKWDNRLKNYKNEIIEDWFFSPSLPDRDYLPKMLAHLVQGMDNIITKNISLTMDSGACAVFFRIRCFLSDRFCGPVFNLLSERQSDNITQWTPKGSHMTSRARELTAFRLMGSREACRALKEKVDRDNPDGCMTMEYAMKENDSLNKRFE